MKVTASDGAANDKFGDGQSIAIDGNYSVIGAEADDDNGDSSGSAYIFYKDGLSWSQQKKLLPSDGAATDLFGSAVAISGNYAVVGAYQDDDGGGNSGSAYIFYKDEGGANNWGQIKKLAASDAESGDFFGASVSISGDYIIVGAFSESSVASGSGSAYIYYKDQGGSGNWGQVQKIKASDPAEYDYFGMSVSISGTYAISGAYGDDDNGDTSGSAYIFYKDQGGSNNWGQVKKLLPGDGAAFDYYGDNVSISGDYVAVGAYYDDDNGGNSGSVYLYYKDQGGAGNWGQIKKLAASDATSNDYFGFSVSISGDYLGVGAYGDDDKGSSAGSGYVFYKDEGGVGNWGELDKYVASDGALNDYFGYSVAITGNYFLSGAYGDDDKGSMSGSAYFINYSGSDSCVPGGPCEACLWVLLTVGEAINIDVDDTVISPTIVPGATTNPDAVGGDNKTIVTIDSNDPQGVTITVDAKDLSNTANQFCLEDSGNPGFCKIKPVEALTTNGADGGDAAWLKLTTANGTTSNKTYQTDAKVNGTLTIFESTDALIEDDTFDVTYDFYANYGVTPQLYEGNLTYTITGKV